MKLDITLNRNNEFPNTILYDERDKSWRIVWDGVIKCGSYKKLDDSLIDAENFKIKHDLDKLFATLRSASFA